MNPEDNTPITYDPTWSADHYAREPHVHSPNGSCIKNRYGPRCDLPEDFFERVEANKDKPKIQRYRIRVVTDVDQAYPLVSKLTDLLNDMSDEDYHPIKIHPHLDGFNRTVGYTVIFYHMPNGPAFTPPF